MDRAEPWADTTAKGFMRVYAYSTRGGNDTAQLTGSSVGGNSYRGYPTYSCSTLTDSARSFYFYARGFTSVTAIGSQSDTSGDRAYLYDSGGDDTYRAAFHDGSEYQGGYLTDETDSQAATCGKCGVPHHAHRLTLWDVPPELSGSCLRAVHALTETARLSR